MDPSFEPSFRGYIPPDPRFLAPLSARALTEQTGPKDLLVSHRTSWGILPQTPVFSLRSARCHWHSSITALTAHPNPKDLLVTYVIVTLNLLSWGEPPRPPGLASLGPSYDVLSWLPQCDHLLTGPNGMSYWRPSEASPRGGGEGFPPGKKQDI
jgi:hypothetical protein